MYSRKIPTRKISKDIEKNIVKELKLEKDVIKAKDVPIKYYNYSFIKDLLEQKYNQKVSLPTIIDWAKRNNFYFSKPERKAHDKEILTNYPGELIQNDSSHHLIICLTLMLLKNGIWLPQLMIIAGLFCMLF